MSNVNVQKLKGRMVENGITIEQLAQKIGVDRSTLYRKMQNDGRTLSSKDINSIIEVLHLSKEDSVAIFLGALSQK